MDPRLLMMGRRPSAAADPNFSKVALLLADGGIDASLRQKSLTVVGSVTPNNTSAPRFGTSGWSFNGGYVYAPAHEDFNFGTSDLTIRTWMRPRTGGASQQTFFSRQVLGSGLAIQLYIYAGGVQALFRSADGSGLCWIDHACGTLSRDEWHFLELCRSGTNVFISADGTGTLTNTGYNHNLSHATQRAMFGAQDDVSPYLRCTADFDDFEIYNGVALHMSNFAVPTGAALTQ